MYNEALIEKIVYKPSSTFYGINVYNEKQPPIIQILYNLRENYKNRIIRTNSNPKKEGLYLYKKPAIKYATYKSHSIVCNKKFSTVEYLYSPDFNKIESLECKVGRSQLYIKKKFKLETVKVNGLELQVFPVGLVGIPLFTMNYNKLSFCIKYKDNTKDILKYYVIYGALDSKYHTRMIETIMEILLQPYTIIRFANGVIGIRWHMKKDMVDDTKSRIHKLYVEAKKEMIRRIYYKKVNIKWRGYDKLYDTIIKMK
jgi:hypothetical protein